ncbi:LysR family transcriptional regulator [Azospirillum brasilense]|jgi:DNA-binding transcriptional LysR family regulator|uniref:LysR family transcriptional regulator n=1 Tax=Azospirillum brasilense TaxID=192 RepID=A0A0P0EYD2_AZOBR|nr:MULTISPECIES: LysR family transcriptional regulator [Azospirillum]ALJ37450.1 LysR family transcriptional regulator [Azospirillum brasilense]MDW7552200.1 LysR family transcriptional regulator [Azospirillum brasilense]MDW7591635.1 LysR family transcriptional regulator [Azospirillum brasilense]MDW7626805.1 LysR family transcriptional regulator [Azospirillum brasilense]MDX5950846.1 LysR family transcriptional regulator [Azospirillum brasilense]
MNLHRIDLNLLVVFDAIARAGSVKDAAPQLALSQPAVSHALNRLRELMNDPLFVRSRNRLVPTERAQSMIVQVADILQSVRVLMNGEELNVVESDRHFRIGISDFTALAIVPRLTRKLQEIAPKITMEMIPVGESTLNQLAAGELDCTFWGLQPPEAPYQSQFLFHDSFLGFCCASHPLIELESEEISIDDYLRFPHAIAQFRASSASPIDVFLKGIGRRRTIALRSPSFMSNITAIAGTKMIATLPSRLESMALSQGLLSFPLPFSIPNFNYSLVWHRRTEADPSGIWFRRLLIDLR